MDKDEDTRSIAYEADGEAIKWPVEASGPGAVPPLQSSTWDGRSLEGDLAGMRAPRANHRLAALPTGDGHGVDFSQRDLRRVPFRRRP